MELNKVSSFIKNRDNPISITDDRIRTILCYVVDCYNQIISDNKIYDYSKRGKIKHENYLRNGLVDDYLRKNIDQINTGTDEYSIFNKDAEESYVNVNDSLKHNDPIDIQIVDHALQKEWNSNDQIYFAIECKRVKKLSDTTEYVKDIRKFTERNYISTRLPFEGQLAFIESKSLSKSKIVDRINDKIKKHASIKTDTFLSEIEIHPSKCTYYSEHKKSFEPFNPLSIYHLMLDYSEIVVSNRSI